MGGWWAAGSRSQRWQGETAVARRRGTGFKCLIATATQGNTAGGSVKFKICPPRTCTRSSSALLRAATLACSNEAVRWAQSSVGISCTCELRERQWAGGARSAVQSGAPAANKQSKAGPVQNWPQDCTTVQADLLASLLWFCKAIHAVPCCRTAPRTSAQSKYLTSLLWFCSWNASISCCLAARLSRTAWYRGGIGLRYLRDGCWVRGRAAH